MLKFEEKYHKLFSILGELLVLNICFIVSLIPVLTIGSAVLSLFSSVQQVFFSGSPHSVKIYFKELKKQLLKGLLLTGISILLLFMAKMNINFARINQGTFSVIVAYFMGAMLVLILLLLPYLLMYIADAKKITMTSIEKATIACFKKPLLSIGLLVINLISCILFILAVELLTTMAMIYFFFGFSFTIYLNCYLITKYLY